MKTFQYILVKFLSKTVYKQNRDYINQWFRKQGAQIGMNAHIYSNIAKNEPHLVRIGNNVTISGDVELVTHDNSISKVINNATDLFGRIEIGNNCFVGTRAIILYGVTIPDDVIVAAGSVVTKSIKDSKVIVAGNPARIISTWDEFEKKSKDLAWSLGDVPYEEMVMRTTNGEKLVKR